MQGPTDVKEEVSVLSRLILNLVLFEGVLPTGCPDGRPHQRLRRGHQAASCALLRFICHMDRFLSDMNKTHSYYEPIGKEYCTPCKFMYSL